LLGPWLWRVLAVGMVDKTDSLIGHGRVEGDVRRRAV
jgi:hypothetical protein